MNLRGECQFYWSESRYQGAPEGWIPISDGDFLEVKGRTQSVAEPGDRSQPWAQDLLLIARAAYVADRKALRHRADDCWTRLIRGSVPLWEPDSWHSADAKHLLSDLMATLTGDKWELHFRPGGYGLPRQGRSNLGGVSVVYLVLTIAILSLIWNIGSTLQSWRRTAPSIKVKTYQMRTYSEQPGDPGRPRYLGGRGIGSDGIADPDPGKATSRGQDCHFLLMATTPPGVGFRR